MKLSISLPDPMALELKKFAKQRDKNLSWCLQKAWVLARTQLFRGDDRAEAKARSLRSLKSLRGALEGEFPKMNSVQLSHQAFSLKK